MIGFVAAMGISCRSFALAYFVHVWELREEKGEVTFRTTDAQGIPFRCIIMVVVFVLGFFAAPAVITGVQNRDNGESEIDGGGGVIFALIPTACFVLFCQIVAMVWSNAMKRDGVTSSNKNYNNNTRDGNNGTDVPLLEQT